MINIGDLVAVKAIGGSSKIKGFVIYENISGTVMQMRILNMDEDATVVTGTSSFVFNKDSIDNAQINEPVCDTGIKITKLDNGEKFYGERNYFRIGTRIISQNCLGRYDGQPMTITGYEFSRSNWTVYYLTKFESESAPDETFYVPVNYAIEIDNRYVIPELPEYRTCVRCGSEFEYHGGELMCPNCAAREYVLPYHRYAPPIKFFSVCNKSATKYFGVEIEVELGGEYDSEAAKVVKAMRQDDNALFAYVSHDSSLNNGFEIITQPATIGYHRMIEEKYKNMFEMLVKDGYRGHNCQNAGIHVHFSRHYFGENEELCIAKLLLLVEKFWNEINIFSRRDYEKSKQYMNKVEDNFGTHEEFIKSTNKSGNHSGRYFAVNLTNPDTIELRMFRSTLNINTYMCILEFCNTLVETAKNKTTEEIREMSFDKLLNARTREYYNSRLQATKFSEA